MRWPASAARQRRSSTGRRCRPAARGSPSWRRRAADRRPGRARPGQARRRDFLPEVSAGQHVDERHERDQAKERPGHLGPARYVAAREKVYPDQHDRERVEKTDQELQDLLHENNLPPRREITAPAARRVGQPGGEPPRSAARPTAGRRYLTMWMTRS